MTSKKIIVCKPRPRSFDFLEYVQGFFPILPHSSLYRHLIPDFREHPLSEYLLIDTDKIPEYDSNQYTKSIASVAELESMMQEDKDRDSVVIFSNMKFTDTDDCGCDDTLIRSMFRLKPKYEKKISFSDENSSYSVLRICLDTIYEDDAQELPQVPLLTTFIETTIAGSKDKEIGEGEETNKSKVLVLCNSKRFKQELIGKYNFFEILDSDADSDSDSDSDADDDDKKSEKEQSTDPLLSSLYEYFAITKSKNVYEFIQNKKCVSFQTVCKVYKIPFHSIK